MSRNQHNPGSNQFSDRIGLSSGWLHSVPLSSRNSFFSAKRSLNHPSQVLFRYNLFVFRWNIAIAGVAQLVEHHVANVVVEGSSPFTRSLLLPPED